MKHFQEVAITEKVCSLYKGSVFVHVYFMGGDGELQEFRGNIYTVDDMYISFSTLVYLDTVLA